MQYAKKLCKIVKTEKKREIESIREYKSENILLYAEIAY